MESTDSVVTALLSLQISMIYVSSLCFLVSLTNSFSISLIFVEIQLLVALVFCIVILGFTPMLLIFAQFFIIYFLVLDLALIASFSPFIVS